jgi:EAL and modified HD-GYP domain-containing signal transduction protein
MTVVAYELLYADTVAPAAASRAATDATLRVVTDAALEIGLDRLAGGLPVHINYPAQLLGARPPLSLHSDRVVIEVLQEDAENVGLIDGIRALRERGHRIALDDYSPERGTPALLDLVDIVKFDVTRHTPDELRQLAPALVRRGLRLIAEKVDTIEQFEHCHQIGFEGFQGDFLERPQTFAAQRVPSSRLGTLRLVAAMQNEDYSIEEVERLVSQDLSISYRVLRCINSSYYSLPRRVQSIRQAIVILGIESLRQLCALVALQGFEARPPSLFVTAMARARMCEQLGRLAGAVETGGYFITGLFSLLDVLTGIPTAQIVDELPLAAPVERALVAEEGEMGAALKCVRAYERAAWRDVAFGTVSAELIRAAYVDAVFWAEQAQALVAH